MPLGSRVHELTGGGDVRTVPAGATAEVEAPPHDDGMPEALGDLAGDPLALAGLIEPADHRNRRRVRPEPFLPAHQPVVERPSALRVGDVVP